MATVHGATILKLAPTLKFGATMVADANPNMIILPPTEYFVTIPGFQPPKQEIVGPMPTYISSMLESWTVDTSKNNPQYLVNPNYMLRQTDGTVLNGVTVLLQKSFSQNNLRILLHGGSSPTDTNNQLFFIDIDEENM